MKLLQENSYVLAQFEDDELELFDVTLAFAELDRLDRGAILDFRNMPVDLSRTECFLIALELQEQKHLRSHKIGLISNSGDHSIGQIARIARGRGLSVQTFSTLDSATGWLQTQADSVTT